KTNSWWPEGWTRDDAIEAIASVIEGRAMPASSALAGVPGEGVGDAAGGDGSGEGAEEGDAVLGESEVGSRPPSNSPLSKGGEYPCCNGGKETRGDAGFSKSKSAARTRSRGTVSRKSKRVDGAGEKAIETKVCEVKDGRRTPRREGRIAVRR